LHRINSFAKVLIRQRAKGIALASRKEALSLFKDKVRAARMQQETLLSPCISFGKIASTHIAFTNSFKRFS